MSEEKLRNKLWDIVNKEFNDFKNEQLQNSKEEIFENAFKISTLSEPQIGHSIFYASLISFIKIMVN